MLRAVSRTLVSPSRAALGRTFSAAAAASTPSLADVVTKALTDKGLEQSVPRVVQAFEEHVIMSLPVAGRLTADEFREMNIKVGERHIIKDAVAEAMADSGVRSISRSYSRGGVTGSHHQRSL